MSSQSIDDGTRSPGASARYLLRAARKGALGTLQAEGGAPLVTLVTVATDPVGAPLLLMSNLAWHTRNLKADTRASLLIDGTGPNGDPLQGIRVSLWGRVAAAGEDARARFLARHPEASFYADFKDFAFYRLEVEGGHSVAGFGRIVTFAAQDFLLNQAQFSDVAAAEGRIVEHMNDDHADAVALYATKLLGAPAGAWRMSAVDPDGCDLVNGRDVLRLAFDEPARTAEEVRKALVALVKKARAMEPAA
ncbi:HugZ family protein [Rhodoligotrophos defluvii]|uniref:HugZ family pyridoxamine 5'-phosphate oxidase n=1 Tax=Rhodoligotrophos defluvii TaxID=2561934 RepID=UPI0010C9F9AE|nr:DUF2470 domain-containing protein [Rhodoligotrophos defluvii]